VSVVVGLIGVGIGAYAVLDVGAPELLGLPVLALGSAMLAIGMVVSGRRVERSKYRPDIWAGAEWLVAGLGVTAAVGVAVTGVLSPEALTMPLFPLAWPAVPPVAVAAIAASTLAGVVTPRPVMTTTGLHVADGQQGTQTPDASAPPGPDGQVAALVHRDLAGADAMASDTPNDGLAAVST
jgi:energy-coupling factor transport system permease protein